MSVLNIVVLIVIAVVAFFVGPLIVDVLSLGGVAAFFAVVGMVVGPWLSTALQNLSVRDSDSESDEVTDVTTLYVGNLPYRANEAAVKEHFSTVAYVSSVRLMRDRRTGKRKGYGFVEVANSDAKKAVKQLNDSEFQERTLKVRLAKEKSNDNE